MRKSIALVVVASIGIAGCVSLSNKRNDTFSKIAPSSKLNIVLIGGNSECGGKTGLWPVRDHLIEDLAVAAGMQTANVSRNYFAWTGDPGDHPGCLPGDDFHDGAARIYRSLLKAKLLDGQEPIVVVGWSNGGATAAQLAEVLNKQGKSVSLLVTLDPVARFHGPPTQPVSKTWINVYTRSDGFFNMLLGDGNFYAGIGNAWNDFDGPVQFCMTGNHSETYKMWRSAALESKEFSAWVHQVLGTRDVIGALSSVRPKEPTVTCPKR